MNHDAYDLLAGRPSATVLLTCEHASERMPAPWAFLGLDARLAGTHWAYDLGAAELTAELARALGATAVLSCFSRLLADPNRPEDSDTLFRAHAEGVLVELNRQVDEVERARRLDGYYRPYHEAVHTSVGASAAEIVLAIHSFTPVYEGKARSMEVGVLFDGEEELAENLARVLADAGMAVALNQPYSGREGLMYAAERHAGSHGRRPLELEVRQDLAVDPAFRARLAAVLARFF